MVDFHSHILPNVDDGSQSIEETFNLIKEAKIAGFDSVISTSHYMEDYYEFNENDRKSLINAISTGLRQQNIDTKLYLGSEIYISENIIDLLENGKASAINGSKYVLFECPLNTEPLNLYNVIYAMQENSLIPILAHPERYSFVQKEPNLIYDLINKGVLMQSNFGSIAGQYGKRAQIIVTKLLENNMVHFLGSDVHKQGTIYPKIDKILKKIEDVVGKNKLLELTDINPSLVLENEKINIAEPVEIELSFSEKLQLKQ